MLTDVALGRNIDRIFGKNLDLQKVYCRWKTLSKSPVLQRPFRGVGGPLLYPTEQITKPKKKILYLATLFTQPFLKKNPTVITMIKAIGKTANVEEKTPSKAATILQYIKEDQQLVGSFLKASSPPSASVLRLSSGDLGRQFLLIRPFNPLVGGEQLP